MSKTFFVPEGVEIEKIIPSKNKKTKQSGFRLFLELKKDEFQHLSGRNLFDAVGEKWQELDQVEKELYKRMSKYVLP